MRVEPSDNDGPYIEPTILFDSATVREIDWTQFDELLGITPTSQE